MDDHIYLCFKKNVVRFITSYITNFVLLIQWIIYFFDILTVYLVCFVLFQIGII